MNLTVELADVLAQAGPGSSFGVVERVVGESLYVRGLEYQYDRPVDPGDRVLLVGESAYSIEGVVVFDV